METLELPECPVCLQPFDGNSTTPRVLACGHSVCEACLIELPKPPFPRTIRCPACTQLVSYPHPQGPSALPKNIDLLRISNPSHINPRPKKPIKSSLQDFIPGLWSHEFYSNWKDWVVPQDRISLETTTKALDWCCLYGRVINAKAPSGTPTRCLLKEHQPVSLFKVGFFRYNQDSRFNYSHVAKVMWILFQMSDVQLAELGLIFVSSLKEDRVCTAYGFWYNEDDKYLYLVFARNDTLLNAIVPEIKDDVSSVTMIGMELCEAVSGLHAAEFVAGCLAPSCFGINEFGHVFIDLNEVLAVGLRVQTIFAKAVWLARNNDSEVLEMNLSDDILEIHAFLSPELLVLLLHREGVDFVIDSLTYEVGYSSDVWSLACMLYCFLLGKPFLEETRNYLSSFIIALIDEHGCGCEGLYMAWLEKVSSLLDTKFGSDFAVMKDLLHKCLLLDPNLRPRAIDLWKCMRESVLKQKFNVMGTPEKNIRNGSTRYCLILGELLQALKKSNNVDNGTSKMDDCKVDDSMGVGDVIMGLSKHSLKCIDLKRHLDCISGLAIGGGFLFSSSFDKTLNVWSLQDFSHVHTLKGHEHRVTAVVFVNREQPVCISGDNGGIILIWGVGVPFEGKPIKRLDEEKEWRYSGIHALAASGSGYFYTGSGDKLIKAWSLFDYTLSCTMIGHKSVVSTLAVSNEVLYSGSFDGTIRLWCLSDHSPLAVLGEEIPACGSVLSLAADTEALVVAHENGCIKVWKNDVGLKPISAHSGSIFSVCKEGKWLFSGGWDKTVIVQEVSGDRSVTQIGTIAGDSVVTALFYWLGKLYVGHADGIIKVYNCGG